MYSGCIIKGTSLKKAEIPQDNLKTMLVKFTSEEDEKPKEICVMQSEKIYTLSCISYMHCNLKMLFVICCQKSKFD